MSIPELAERMGHSPQMTVGTYTHVIRDLNGWPAMSAEEQIERSRLRRLVWTGVDAWWKSSRGGCLMQGLGGSFSLQIWL
jgi:hypothetical protein